MTAAERETTDAESITIDWSGVPLSLPASVEDMDLDALEAFESGKAVTAVRALLGEAGYKQARLDFEKHNGRRPNVRDLGALLDKLAAEYGFGTAGN